MHDQTTLNDARREALHCEVDALGHANWRVRAILHAMVAAGSLTVLECQLPACVMADRKFDPQSVGRGHIRKGLVIDHIIPQLQGGSHRPENLQVIHANCNVARARGWKMPESAKEAIRAAALKRIAEDPGYAKRRVAGRHYKGSRHPVLTASQVAEMRAACAAGATVKSLADMYAVGYSTARDAIAGDNAYTAL